MMNRIARELALDLGEATFRPDASVTRQGSRLTSLTAFQGSFVLAVVLCFLSSYHHAGSFSGTKDRDRWETVTF